MEILKGSTDVPIHGDVDTVFGVVPVESQTTVVKARHVN